MTPEAIQQAALAGVSLPVRAEVRTATADGSGFLVDVEVLDLRLRGTGEVLERVPAPPLWLGRGGRGTYAPPESGSVVLVEWVAGDRGHPVITAALAAEEAQAPPRAVPVGAWATFDGRGGELWIEDGTVRMVDADGAVVRVAGDRVEIASSIRTLLAVIEELIDAVVALQTVGAPNTHSVSPGSQAALRATKAHLQEVLA